MVCEPIVRASVEIPTSAIGAVMAALARLDAAVETPSLQGTLSTIEAVLPAARAKDLQQQLPGLTGGEGVLDSSFAGYQPVSGDQPSRTGDDGESPQF
jgi:ribosomal protection tetracycline resistance protein